MTDAQARALIAAALWLALQAPAPPAHPQAPVGEAARLEERARALYFEGNLEEAARVYHQLAAALSENRARADALLTAAWLEHRSEQYGRSQASLADALRLHPDLPFQAENYSPEFAEIFRSAREVALAERGRRAGQLTQEGVEHLRAGDREGARRALRAALAVHPEDPVALYNLALLDSREGRSEAAAVGFRKVLSLADAAWGVTVTEDLKIRSLSELASIDLAAGRLDEALSGFQKVLALDHAAGGEVLADGLRAQVRANLGYLFYQLEMFEDAESNLVRALELDPEQGNAWHNLGLARERLGRSEEAVRALRRAQALLPENEAVMQNLGLALARAGDWRGAAEVYAAGVRRRPESPELWLQLGLARKNLGDEEVAMPALEKVLELDADGGAGLARQAAAHLAYIRFQRGEYQRAIGFARRSVEWAPKDPERWNLLALALQASGDSEGAIEAHRRALELDPKRAESAYGLAVAYLEMRSYREAEGAFRRALELRPGYSEAAGGLERLRAALREAGAAIGLRLAAAGPANGALVEAVRERSAASGKLRAGDEIRRVDGREIASADDLLHYLYKERPSGPVIFEIVRGGRLKQVRLKLDWQSPE